MNTSTRDTPVRYGRAYLSDEQWARQEAALNDAPKALYGPGYLAGVGEPVPVAPEAPQYSMRQLQEMLNATGTVESYTLALQAEGDRAAGPRKSAVTLLLAAAKRLNRQQDVAIIDAMLSDPDGTVDE